MTSVSGVEGHAVKTIIGLQQSGFGTYWPNTVPVFAASRTAGVESRLTLRCPA